ncbi:MAG: PA2778 family cysteine peptidase [Pseudomonadota bacterium]
MSFIDNARSIAGVFFLGLLGACATPPQTQALLEQQPAGLPPRAELADVVFYPQQEHQCGPAALAMALHSSGVDVQPEQLSDLLYIPEKQGSLQVEMLAAARRQGRVAYLLKPQLQDVLAEVAAGNPVVVLQNLGLSWYPVWHYAVVVGYDLAQRELILRSGNERRQVLPFATFEHTWGRGNHWAMLVLAPGRLPHSAVADDYMLALLALERASPQTDTDAGYVAALHRWPDHLAVQVAVGNRAYVRHDLIEAERIFIKATQDHPDAAAAFNNLAQVQGELGKLEAALASVRRAVELGGPLQVVARDTLAEIERKLQRTR